MNKVILVGNLTKTPELKQTQNGILFSNFTVAVSRRFSKDGQQQTDFINCVAWRQQAEFLCKYFQKGSSIQLCGNIQTRSWENSQGQIQYITEVVVEELAFNGKKSDNNESRYNPEQEEELPENEFFDIDNEGDLPF
jgi:single-strand DNA-binding protein